MVSAEDAVFGVARGHAPLQLIERALVNRAECPDVAH
jgi:hypothetical protein